MADPGGASGRRSAAGARRNARAGAGAANKPTFVQRAVAFAKRTGRAIGRGARAVGQAFVGASG